MLAPCEYDSAVIAHCIASTEPPVLCVLRPLPPGAARRRAAATDWLPRLEQKRHATRHRCMPIVDYGNRLLSSGPIDHFSLNHGKTALENSEPSKPLQPTVGGSITRQLSLGGNS